MTGSWRRALTYVSVVIAVFLAWELLTVTGAVKPLLLAAPSAVVAALATLFAQPSHVLGPIGTTLLETAIAFAIAFVLGVVVGLGIGLSALLRKAYEPLLTSANALPLVILYPVLAAVLGVGGSSKIVLGALYAFFPIAIATLQGAANVDIRLTTAARTMGATRAQIIRSVVFPAITGPVIAGMRVALALATVTIIAAEFIAGSDGVGYELAAASQGLDTPTLFAWVVLACALTIVINVLFTQITNALTRGIKR